MDPRLVGTFPAVGSDGQRYAVYAWMTFRPDPAAPGGPWVPAALPTLTTGDGRPVSPTGQVAGGLRLDWSGIALAADADAAADVLAEFRSLYESVTNGPGVRLPT